MFNMTLALALLILKSPGVCYINHNSFLKDFLFLEVAFLHHFFDLKDEIFQLPLSIPLIGLGVFIFFIFSTFKLPEYLGRDTLDGFSTAARFELITKIYRNTFKHVYDLVILDLEKVQKFSGRINWTLFISPVINVLILLTYCGLWNNERMILVSILSSLVTGVILIKASKSSNLIVLVYIYGLVASILHVYLFYPLYNTILTSVASNYNLNPNYLRTVILPILLSIMELFLQLYYSSIGNSTLAVCSLIYSTIFNMLFIKSVVKIIESQTKSQYSNNQLHINNFCYVFGVLASIVILFNYIVRNHRISRDLAYILIFSYVLFNLSPIMEYKTYIIQQS